MTIQEAILKSLEELNRLVNSNEVYQHIIRNGYYDFSGALTPQNTISSRLGDLIRNGDARVKRIKQSGGMYAYYLANIEPRIESTLLGEGQKEIPQRPVRRTGEQKLYEERDLHMLLSSYLKNTGVYSKTIFHEQSTAKDNNQIWTHPDMVGLKLLNLQTTASQNLLKATNGSEILKLSAYELKREINSDNELKKAYFQTVSNSSWANYGYLVAFEFSDSLYNEMERLNQSFGIGIIQLEANPYKSRLLFPASYRSLDYKTVDKLCYINHEFTQFIEHTEKLLVAADRYYKALISDLESFSDNFFRTNSEIEAYCKAKNIPIADDEFND